jgi:hypothetical protein
VTTEQQEYQRTNWRSRARTCALTELTHQYWQEYRMLLLEERTKNRYGSPQSRAKTRLSHRHREQVSEIYAMEMTRLLALPVSQRAAKRPPYLHVERDENGKVIS